MPEDKTTVNEKNSEIQTEEQRPARQASNAEQQNQQDSSMKGGQAVEEKKAEAEALQSRVTELEKEAQSNYDRFVRVTADFENFKKRTAREMSDLRKFANEKLLKEILSVVDNLQRAIESGAKTDSGKDKLLEGVEITLKDILRMLEKYGVKEFDSKGEVFNPAYHQAMMQEQTDQYPDNTILSELQKGYTIHDRLLRPAMVVVGRNPSDTKSKNQDKI